MNELRDGVDPGGEKFQVGRKIIIRYSVFTGISKRLESNSFRIKSNFADSPHETLMNIGFWIIIYLPNSILTFSSNRSNFFPFPSIFLLNFKYFFWEMFVTDQRIALNG